MREIDNKIVVTLLSRMVSLKLWKSNHIRYTNLKHCGFPKDKLKDVDRTINFLLRKGYLQYYNKSKKAIQLNWEKKEEIFKMIESSYI
jgi:hypothetical protein